MYRRFGTTYWASSLRKTYWPLKMEPIGCSETSVQNYHSTLCNIPEERRSDGRLYREKFRPDEGNHRQETFRRRNLVWSMSGGWTGGDGFGWWPLWLCVGRGGHFSDAAGGIVSVFDLTLAFVLQFRSTKDNFSDVGQRSQCPEILYDFRSACSSSYRGPFVGLPTGILSMLWITIILADSHTIQSAAPADITFPAVHISYIKSCYQYYFLGPR
jgi:hypothetical protein